MKTPTKERIEARAKRLPVQRAIARYGVDCLWGYIYTCEHIERRLSWAMILVRTKNYGSRAAYQTLTALLPVIKEMGFEYQGNR